MHVYISVDMEGIAGIATSNQVRRGTDDFPDARVLMTREANAAIAGAVEGGATRILVNDSHGDMANLLPEDLDPRAELLMGAPKLVGSMMEGLDDSFDVAILIGYHAGAGVAQAVLAHTYSGACFYGIRLNGADATEAYLNAVLAAHHGVPVGLVSGDDKICDTVTATLPGARTVAVKRGIGQMVTATLHPEQARSRISAAVAETVRNAGDLEPLPIAPEYTLEVDLVTLRMAEACAVVPGCERTAARTVRYTSANYNDVFRCLLVWMALGAWAT